MATKPAPAPSVGAPPDNHDPAVPRLVSGLVERPRLFALLDRGAAGPVTLLCAPAGSGKTMLLHQVIKQTDVVLATYLVGHHFSAQEKRRAFDYYDPLTTGDSTLSACDHHKNTADGIHIASASGTWLALVAGFGGLRDSDGEIHFHPRMPAQWTRDNLPRAAQRQVMIVVTADQSVLRPRTMRALDRLRELAYCG